jgi:hypothetical protein
MDDRTFCIFLLKILLQEAKKYRSKKKIPVTRSNVAKNKNKLECEK